MNKTDSFLKGISIQTIITISLAIIELIYFSFMSRLLTKTDFGYYAALTGIMSIFFSVSEAGLGASIIQKKNITSIYISTVFTLSLLLGTSATIVLYFSAPTLSNIVADSTLEEPLKLLTLTILPHSFVSLGNAILYKEFKFSVIGINTVISYLCGSIIAITLAYCGKGLYSVILYSLSIPIINFFLLYIKLSSFPSIKIKAQDAKHILSFGGWLTLSTLTNNLTHQLDRFFLPKWMSIQMLGAYNRPSGFVNTISTKINSIFDTVLFPMLTEFQNNESKINQIFFKAISLLNSFSSILAILFFLNSDLIINIFFGSEWMDLSVILKILSISLVFSIDNRLVDCFLRSTNLVRQGFYLRILGLTLTLIGIYVGSKYSIEFVAFYYVIATTLTIIIKMIYLARKISIPVTTLFIKWIYSWKASIPLSIFIIPYYLFPHNTYIQIPLLFLQLITLLIECCFFPKIIGEEYTITIYPKIIRPFKKIIYRK